MPAAVLIVISKERIVPKANPRHLNVRKDSESRLLGFLTAPLPAQVLEASEKTFGLVTLEEQLQLPSIKIDTGTVDAAVHHNT